MYISDALKYLYFDFLIHSGHQFFFVVKGPAAEATDAPQPYGLLCNPMMKTKRKMISFFFNFSK
jgi:hypothetical protein